MALPSALDREHAARADAMQEAAKGAKDRDVRAFATKRLPALKRHLELARSAAAAAERKRAP